MSKFMNAIQALIDDIKAEKVWVEELNEHSQRIAKLLASGASFLWNGWRVDGRTHVA